MQRIRISAALLLTLALGCGADSQANHESSDVSALDAGLDSSGGDTANEPDLTEVVCGEGFEQVNPIRARDEVKGCTRLVAPVHMPDYRPDDFELLSTLRIAEERFSIFRAHETTSYSAFSSLERVGGDMLLRHSEGMPENLRGFESLTHISGTLVIGSNYGLRDLDGLENLERVGSLEIDGNSDLEDISAIHGLIVDGDVRFEFNPSLAQASVDAWAQTADISGELIVD